MQQLLEHGRAAFRHFVVEDEALIYRRLAPVLFFRSGNFFNKNLKILFIGKIRNDSFSLKSVSAVSTLKSNCGLFGSSTATYCRCPLGATGAALSVGFSGSAGGSCGSTAAAGSGATGAASELSF